MTHGRTLYIQGKELADLAEDALRGVGTPAATATAVARVLIDAELRGHPSHGVAMLPVYLERVRRGGIDAEAHPTWTPISSTVGSVRGNGAFGQLAAELAASQCASAAAEHGLAAVGVRDNNHIGMLAAYRHHFADSQTIGLILNVSGPSVSAPGARHATLGNDAICLVVPRLDDEPFIIDFAAGTVACGKIRAAALRGEKVPSTWLLDASGQPSTDPEDLDSGGSVPVFGGYKGLGVLLIVEVLAGILAGATVSPLVNRQRHQMDLPMGCSQLFIGFDSQLFGATDTARLIDVIANAVHEGYEGIPPHPFLPEQYELSHSEAARKQGISVPDALAAELGWVSA
ncbi:Ldh family oxidoreductase [Streptomyces sp. NPDC005408]|uniref:Ldh family oxidoreductase n=1 Tax=Streptomyces sp. NPDC005408 TaxID=3155341 RepID=UPI0033AF3F9A